MPIICSRLKILIKPKLPENKEINEDISSRNSWFYCSSKINVTYGLQILPNLPWGNSVDKTLCFGAKRHLDIHQSLPQWTHWGGIMVPITQQERSLTQDSIGPPSTRMPTTLSPIVTFVNVKERLRNVMRCHKTPSKISRIVKTLVLTVSTRVSHPQLHFGNPERIIKKRTKNEAKSTKPDSEWESKEKTKPKSKQNVNTTNQSPKTPHFNADPLHEDSTSQRSSSNVRPSHTPFELLGKWTKNHPIAHVIEDPSRSVSTRKQLQTDVMWCYFDAFLTSIELKNYKEAMLKSSWIDAMQEEIHEFKRLQVGELVLCPNLVMLIKLKWIFKVKKDECGDVLKNKARLVAKGY
ncbi:integrase, catalytic region, zinc finger, CCHC-type containing protein [Tanacetum coccineum]